MSKPGVKGKPRGKPFTGADDPRRIGGGGRPRDQVSITAILRRKIGESDSERAERVAEKILALAEEGDKTMLAYLVDRLDGRAQENVAMSGGVSLYEQGASQPYDKAALLEAMKRLSGGK